MLSVNAANNKLPDLFQTRLVQAIGLYFLLVVLFNGVAVISATVALFLKSHTLIPVSVPITNQYFFGANLTAFTGASQSIFPRFLPSTKFQIMTWLSLPPDAK